MKKFFIFIILAVTAVFTTVSCDQTSGGIIDYDSRQVLSGIKLVDLTFEGHTHQFVFSHSLYDTELDHWPSCKYCTDSTDTETKPARQELQELKRLQPQSQREFQELKRLQPQSVNLQYSY